MSKRPAAFLDRDGTINVEVEYLSEPEQIVLLPGAAAAIARLNRAGIVVVVVTNQAGVARGYFPESRVAQIHARLDELLEAEGARIDRYYYCPHHPTAGLGAYRVECDCRKPKPGMLLAAAKELDLDLARSVLIGDKLLDLEAARQAGCEGILVRTGYGAELECRIDAARHGRVRVEDDLAAAIDGWLTRRAASSP
jgi:D-glycero-D-manno-heptose 1,7-bisphosphate phosphatase